MHNPNIEIVAQASIGLINIAGDNPGNRDLIIQEDAVNKIANVLDHGPKTYLFVQWVSRALAKLCGGNPSPELSLVKRAFPSLTVVLNNNDDEEILYRILHPLEKLIWKSDF